MEDTIIQYNTAVLAKNKNFNIPTQRYYNSNKGLIVNYEDSGCNEREYYFDADDFYENWNDNRVVSKNNETCYGCRQNNYYSEVYSAPTQSILQKWLREVYNLHIDIRTNIFAEGKYFLYIMENKEPYYTKWNSNTYYDTYEQALEEGLYNALKLI